MDAAPTASPQSQLPPIPRRRRRAGRIVAVLIVVVVVALLWRCAGARQSAVRLKTHNALRTVEQAAAVYQLRFNAPPTLDDLLSTRLLDGLPLDEFSRCEPEVAAGEPPVVDAWVVQTVPCRAVRKGEAWGGPGETTDRDIPPCRFVLMKDWTVRQIDEPDYQRDFAGRVKLTPLR